MRLRALVEPGSRWVQVLAWIVLFLCVLTPRLADRDVFVTADEDNWLVRGARFRLALIDSDWLYGPGSEDRLSRIVLHGLHGPITINQEPYNREGALSMPGLASTLTDEKIAGILTYIRREWGEFAPPIETATVTTIRAAHADRRGRDDAIARSRGSAGHAHRR